MTSAVDHAKAAMIAEHMELPEKGILPEQQQHSNGDLQLINTIGDIPNGESWASWCAAAGFLSSRSSLLVVSAPS